MKRVWAILVAFYMIISLFVFVVLTRFFEISDITGIGQLFADVLLFPTVIIGFWITITEFRKSQALPNLKLYWRGDMATRPEKNCLVLTTSRHNVKMFSLHLYVKNDGKAVATWYRLTFDIPRDLSQWNPDTYSVQWYRGDDSCWNSVVNMAVTRHEFKSNGQHALYPGEEVHIATVRLRLFPQITYPGRVHIRQSIVTDRTEIQDGAYKIKIRREDFAHPM